MKTLYLSTGRWDDRKQVERLEDRSLEGKGLRGWAKAEEAGKGRNPDA